jgi:hypothetical protein
MLHSIDGKTAIVSVDLAGVKATLTGSYPLAIVQPGPPHWICLSSEQVALESTEALIE